MIIRAAWMTNSSSTSFTCYGIICDDDMIDRMNELGKKLPGEPYLNDDYDGVLNFVNHYSAHAWYSGNPKKYKIGIHTNYEVPDSVIIYAKDSRKETENYYNNIDYIPYEQIDETEKWAVEVFQFCKEHGLIIKPDNIIGFISATDVDHHF